MSRTAAILWTALLYWVCGALQQAVAYRVGIFGANPDFLLVALSIRALDSTRTGGIVCGFFAGFVNGAIAGANMTHYVISRTVGGYLVSWSREFGFELNAAVAFVCTVALTLVSQILLMFLAPPAEIVPFLGATILSAAYNGVLVLPLYLLHKRFFVQARL